MRVAVVGCSGAGKSTLATRMSGLLQLPLVHLDALHWKPGWQETSDVEFRAVQRDALQGPAWIADGNYGSTFDARLPHADLIVLLDYSRWTCLLGVVRRAWRYRGRSRPDMAAGCPERLTLEFLRYVWSFRRQHLPRVFAAVAEAGKQDQLVCLRSRREADRFLQEASAGRVRNT